MEQPLSLAAEDVRDAKVRVLRAIPPLTLNDLVVGQYTASPDGQQPVSLGFLLYSFNRATLTILKCQRSLSHPRLPRLYSG
jgi:hypothetical protein